MRELESELTYAYQRRLLGRRLEVLVEGADPQRPGNVQGTSCRYLPVSFRGHAPALLRKVVPVRAARIEAGMIVGEPEAAPLDRVPLPMSVQ